LCPFSVLVQHPSGDGDEGDHRWISRRTTMQIVGRIVKNFRYADDVILLSTSEAELQELVDRLDSLLINVDKTKVMASDGIACHILIKKNQLEKVDTFPYLRSLITEDGECTTEFRTKLNVAGDRGITTENMEKSQHTYFNENTTNESDTVACSNVRLRKLDTQKEGRNMSRPL